MLDPLARSPFHALAAFDCLLGVVFLLSPAAFFTTASYDGARHVAPIPVWGALMLALGAAIWCAAAPLRQYITAVGGVLLPGLFALTFLVTCVVTSWHYYAQGSPTPPTNPVSAVLWEALVWMHYRAGVLYGPRMRGDHANGGD